MDHLAFDPEGARLFVAEVANGSLDVVDTKSGKVTGRIAGLDEPQGVEWLPEEGEIVVACGDGSVRFYSGADLRLVASVDLRDDADDVRVDPRNGRVVVGYGNGGLAMIDPATHRLTSRVIFHGHPEGFQLSGDRAYVNVPGDGAILELDLDRSRVLARWPTGLHRLNFPMAIDPSGRTIAIAYRLPAAWARIEVATGKTVALHPACGDADDIYEAGSRELIVCGAGYVDVWREGSLEARVRTGSGARTGLYLPALHTLYVAVPDRHGAAAVWALELRDAG
ncbi:MAG: hypothetical protein GC201_17390 [Alphaproteobacteria bacterium]|nr:hypothetical protein [Alphaproteobacteria bacterium]